jgi:hypothetical protein
LKKYRKKVLIASKKINLKNSSNDYTTMALKRQFQAHYAQSQKWTHPPESLSFDIYTTYYRKITNDRGQV